MQPNSGRERDTESTEGGTERVPVSGAGVDPEMPDGEEDGGFWGERVGRGG